MLWPAETSLRWPCDDLAAPSALIPQVDDLRSGDLHRCDPHSTLQQVEEEGARLAADGVAQAGPAAHDAPFAHGFPIAANVSVSSYRVDPGAELPPPDEAKPQLAEPGVGAVVRAPHAAVHGPQVQQTSRVLCEPWRR